MEITTSGCYERKSQEHLDAVKDSVTSSTVKPVKKKRKTSAERQREYRLRQKKLKEAQNINKVKPPKKTRAEYQKAYRIRKKLKKLNDNNSYSSSGSDDESLRIEGVSSSESSQPLRISKKKRKTSAERQREYRQRRKKLKESQNINKDKPPKKTRADYQRAYRIRKKLKRLNEINTNSISGTDVIPVQDGLSGYIAPLCTTQLAPSIPDAEPLELTNKNKKSQERLSQGIIQKLKGNQQFLVENHNFFSFWHRSFEDDYTPGDVCEVLIKEEKE